MSAERCDFYSDDEFQQARQMEEAQRQQEEEGIEHQKQYEEMLNHLEHIGNTLGIGHCIEFLEHLGKESKALEEKVSRDIDELFGL